MMSIIFITGMLLYEGYRLWLWGNMAPTLPILPPYPLREPHEIDNKTDYISTTMTDPSVTTFDSDKHLNESGFTLAPDIDNRTTTRDELSTVKFITNTSNVFSQAKDGTTTASGPVNDSQSIRNPLPLKSEIDSISDQYDNSKNFSKLSDLLLLLRLHPNTTHKVNIYIKRKNKEYYNKPTAFDIIFNALNSKPQSITSDLNHIMNSKKPSHGEIPTSSVINAETNTVTDQLNLIYQLASRTPIPQNTSDERKAGKIIMSTTPFEITPNTANEDTLQIIQLINESYKFTRDPRKTEKGLIQDSNYFIPYTNSHLTFHEIEATLTTDKTETKSKGSIYRLPTPLAYNKNTKNQEAKATLTQPFKRVKRNCRSRKLYALNKFVRRQMRHSRLYYTKSYQATDQKTMELQTVNTTIESNTPTNIANKSNRTTYSFKPQLDIDDDEDEFSEETEVNTQYESESTTSSLKTLDVIHKFDTPIDNEENQSESVEDTEETATKSNKNKTHANFKGKLIEIPVKVDEITTINDEEDETESGEVTEVSPATQSNNHTFIVNKNKRTILPTKKGFILKKHFDAEVGSDNIIHEKNHRKTRTSKPYFHAMNSTKNIVSVTKYTEDESDSAETTSVSTTIADDPEETPAEGMDILFILKTRFAKPTVAAPSFISKDLLQILVPNSTLYRLDNDTSYLDSYIRNYQDEQDGRENILKKY